MFCLFDVNKTLEGIQRSERKTRIAVIVWNLGVREISRGSNLLYKWLETCPFNLSME